ncbi:hypothetical protein GGU11DRAFT_847873 [Lentinula aff. detonsa]|nr:hypothetical protein GGU11DRAFT_847873 [Lentinula aff. detonsa]
MDIKIDYYSTTTSVSRPFQDILPIELHIPNRDSKLNSILQPKPRATLDGPALIILALVTANIRNCYLPSSKLRALDVFLALSSDLTDKAKLDRMCPYVEDLLHDKEAIVRLAAIRTLDQVLVLVAVITPSHAASSRKTPFQTSGTLFKTQKYLSDASTLNVSFNLQIQFPGI